MAAPEPPLSGRSEQISASQQQQQQQAKLYTGYESFKHNASLAMLVAAPLLIAVPPRKLDLYTFSLAGAFVASANQLTVERTGRGLLSQFNPPRWQTQRLEEQQMQQRTEVRDRQRRLLEESKSSVPEEVTRRRTDGSNNTDVAGSLEEKAKEIWMGGETEGWKERRLKEEQKKLDKGEGYGSMIVDQIWEVWNWGEKKGQELQRKDEEVLQKQKESGQSKTDNAR